MGLEWTLNKSQHTKLTLEKKLLQPLLLGFKLATFWSRVWHLNQPAILAIVQLIPMKRVIHIFNIIIILQYKRKKNKLDFVWTDLNAGRFYNTKVKFCLQQGYYMQDGKVTQVVSRLLSQPGKGVTGVKGVNGRRRLGGSWVNQCIKQTQTCCSQTAIHPDTHHYLSFILRAANPVSYTHLTLPTMPDV